MQKYRFSNPVSVVEVSQSPLDHPEPGNRLHNFDCLCRGLGHKKSPHKMYKITATTPAAAARMAIESYRKEFYDGKEGE